MIRYSIPINWQDDYFEKIDFSQVEEVFGKLREDFVGGGRSSFTLPSVSKARMRSFVGEVKKRNLKFNYLINATCLNNKEMTRQGYRELRVFLDWLVDSGVDIVTLSLPFILEIIKKYYPTLQASVSTQVRVDCLERVRYWEELGADAITLSYVDVNRNFKELKRICENAACKVQLLANLICRKHCPFVELHANYHSHSSQKTSVFPKFGLEYYMLFCSAKVFSDPETIVRSSWIRPEDVALYEEMGIKKIKLVERGLTTEALAKIVTAYTKRSYEGNFMDLLPTMSKYIYQKGSMWSIMMKAFFNSNGIRIPQMISLFRSIQKFRNKKDYYDDLGLFIDKKKLNGVIEYFMKNDCSAKDCKKCTYCRDVAAKTIRTTMDKPLFDAYRGELEGVREKLVCGDYFK